MKTGTVAYLMFLLGNRDAARNAGCPNEWQLALNAAILDASADVLRSTYRHYQTTHPVAAVRQLAEPKPIYRKFAQRSNFAVN